MSNKPASIFGGRTSKEWDELLYKIQHNIPLYQSTPVRKDDKHDYET